MDIVITVVLVAFVLAALVMLTVPMKLDAVRFRDTTPAYAYGLVEEYALSTSEQRFGYPSGYFGRSKRCDPPDRMLMKELHPSGTLTDGAARSILMMGAGGTDAGCLGFILLAVVVGCMALPFIAVSVLDRLFRLLLRSRIDVRITADGDDSLATFSFFGPSGYLIRRRYAEAFAAPALPASVFPPEPAVVLDPEPAADPDPTPTERAA